MPKGFADMQMNEKVLRFYLTTNLKRLFNEVEDFYPVKDSEKSLKEDDKVVGNETRVNVNGEEYAIVVNNEGINFKSLTNPLAFKVSSKNMVMNNFVISMDNEDCLNSEYYNVSLGQNNYYDYQKTITDKDNNKIELPLYRLSNMRFRKNNNEYFNLSVISNKQANSKSFLKSLYDYVNSVKGKNERLIATSDALDDILDYLPDIYDSLYAETVKAEKAENSLHA